MNSSIVVLLLFTTLNSVPFLNVVVAVAGDGENPFTRRGYLIRYWNKQISNDLPKPSFLLDKASPLTAAQFAVFSKLADDLNTLSDHLPDFCNQANLLCFPDLSPSLEKHVDIVNFISYRNKNFTNYGSDRIGGADSFENYSDGENVVSDNFRRYSRDSIGHGEKFTGYAAAVNVPDQSFNGYGTTSTGGEGKFSNYNGEVNKFTSYGKNSNGAKNEFTNYAKNSNVMSSIFTNYGETGNGGNDTFTSYGDDTNVPENTYKNYGAESNGAVEKFTSYRSDSTVGDDEFQSYGKKSNAAAVDFENYGQSGSDGGSRFSGYGIDAIGQTVDFKLYNPNTTFKSYAKEGITFANYSNQSSSMAAKLAEKGKMVNKWVVEPGKFFREKMLKKGNIIPMPDIRDKMPKRSFLPRVIISKLPFSTSDINKLKNFFHAGDDVSMEKILVNSLTECERKPSRDETKRCAASIEDMIDFATTVLGRDVAVRTTENTRGYNGNIMIGEVEGVNGGNVTKSVSCHQSLFPYLLYYCHSVPKVRVYEADLLDPNSKAKINRGVAICHLDTGSWSPGHGAFVALGSGPGLIEVCHWIFENDMTWTIAD
ncbi:hypothetical protein DH2020_049746 [Rehmannia glutinosa]|uniref:BURP domain-containing protein n=1 Tax=Rehmannia glutinosa TaxID=99300 RepID=A0ABR0U1Y8_REHGL